MSIFFPTKVKVSLILETFFIFINCFQYKFYHPPYGIKSLKVAKASS